MKDQCCIDTFILRHKNTMSDLWWREQDKTCSQLRIQVRVLCLRKKKQTKKKTDLQDVILTGLSVPISKRVTNIDSLFWFWVCLCVRVSDAAGAVGERCGVCDIMYLSLKWYMVIIRLRLQSIPICFFHTGPHWPTIKFTTSRHLIPHLYWEWKILKAVVFSVKFWLIDAAITSF